MSEAYDPLEAELSALRPRDGSPELRARIAAHRARSLPPGSRSRRGLTLAAGGLAAACVAAAILLLWGSGRRVVPKQTIARVQSEPHVVVEDTEPSPLAYRCWPDHPTNWMPCSTRAPGSPRDPTPTSRESVPSLGRMSHSAPY